MVVIVIGFPELPSNTCLISSWTYSNGSGHYDTPPNPLIGSPANLIKL